MASMTQFGSSKDDEEKQHEQGQFRDPRVDPGEIAIVSKQAQEVVQQARHVAEAQAEALMSWVKERPLTSVLIGAAIGYVLGRVARR
jgi:ElaB/YqjD/DUF883 family membrane-anchored ribosome-binding protein